MRKNPSPTPRPRKTSVWIGMNPPADRGPARDLRLGPCEAKVTRPSLTCDRCAKPGTPDNPVEPGKFTGRPRHVRGCSAVHGPKVGRG